MNTKNQLPENWVVNIEDEKDSPLLPKFKEWFRDMWFKCNPEYLDFHGIGLKYYGCLKNRQIYSKNLKPNFTELTLQQWHDSVFGEEFNPNQGEMVWYKDKHNRSLWSKGEFIGTYEGRFLIKNSSGYFHLWDEIKPISHEQELQPLIDQLQQGAKERGMKAIVTFEKL